MANLLRVRIFVPSQSGVIQEPDQLLKKIKEPDGCVNLLIGIAEDQDHLEKYFHKGPNELT